LPRFSESGIHSCHDLHHDHASGSARRWAPWTFLSDPRERFKGPRHRGYTDPEHNPMIPHTLVLADHHPQHRQRLLVGGRPSVIDTCDRRAVSGDPPRPGPGAPDWRGLNAGDLPLMTGTRSGWPPAQRNPEKPDPRPQKQPRNRICRSRPSRAA
jgi:hypothetical protein